MSDNNHKKEEEEDLKRLLPFARSWNAIYAFVIGELFVLIILFYLFSKYYA